MSKDKFVTIGDISIKTSNIKAYGISGSEEIGNLDDQIISATSDASPLPKIYDAYLSDPFESLPKRLVGSYKQRLKNIAEISKDKAKKTSAIVYVHYLKQKREELAKHHERRYFYVTTYQGDNHKFHASSRGVHKIKEYFEDELDKQR